MPKVFKIYFKIKKKKEDKINILFFLFIITINCVKYNRLKMKIKIFTVAFIVLFFGQQLVFGNSIKFKDESQIPSWAESSVDTLVELGIIKGNIDGQLLPLEEINRAEFCKILILATNTEIKAVIEPSFPDVQAEDWFFDYVETAKANGWISGYPDGLFRPADKINRAEVSKILVKAFNFEFLELETDQKWYEQYVRTLDSLKLLPHDIDLGNFNASMFPSRIEIIDQIYRVLIQTGKVSLFEGNKDSSQKEVETYIPKIIAPLESKIHPDAGTLYLEVKKGINQKIYVYKNEKNVDVLRLNLNAKYNDVKISEFQFRIIGSGKFSDYSKAWLELEGKIVSSQSLILGDLVDIKLNQEFTIPRNKTKELVLKVDLSGQGKKGTSSRFVLYLPEWIASNTAKKIGFFPLGGEDLEIKN